jgi:hypothetical protein
VAAIIVNRGTESDWRNEKNERRKGAGKGTKDEKSRKTGLGKGEEGELRIKCPPTGKKEKEIH